MDSKPDDMSKQSDACPDVAMWGDFVRGDVDQLTLESLSRHLADCSRCLECVEEISSRQLRRDQTVLQSPFIKEPQFERMLQRASQLVVEVTPATEESPTTTRSTEPLPEQLGRFVVRGILGTGGFGRVYLADDPLLQRTVAIKVPRRDSFESEGALSDFLNEARHAAALDHPGVVPIHDVITDANGRTLIVMKHIEGRSLSAVLRAERLTLAQAVTLVIQVAQAAHFAHELGFVHRDLKPSNILIDTQGRPHVTDFGLVLDLHPDVAGRATERAGTPHYMAPEQIRASSTIDRRADVWALGVMLAEIVHGRRPFPQRDRAELFEAIAHSEPQMDSAAETVELDAIIRRCLAKSATERFPTAEALAQELTRWKLRHFPEGWDRWRFGWRRNAALALAMTVIALGA